MGETSAASPMAKMPPKMHAPHKKMQADASAHARTGARTSRPVSMNTGAANAVFIPA